MIMEVERKYLVLPFHFHCQFFYSFLSRYTSLLSSGGSKGEGEGGNPVMSPLVSFDRGQARFDPLLCIVKKPFLSMVVPPEYSKTCHFKVQNSKIFWRGGCAPPQSSPTMGRSLGRGDPLPMLYPLRAFGAHLPLLQCSGSASAP